MRRKFTSLKQFVLSLTLLTITTFTINSCKKEVFRLGSDNINGALTISEAKEYFNQQVLPNSPLSLAAKQNTKPDLSKVDPLLYKEPIWKDAHLIGVDDGVALAVPIKFTYQNYLITGPESKVNFSQLNYLLVKKDSIGKMHANWIIHIPDKEYLKGKTGSYLGWLIVQDWDGNFVKEFKYDKGGKVTRYERVSEDATSNGKLFSPSSKANHVSLSKKMTLTNNIGYLDGDTTELDTIGIIDNPPIDTLVTGPYAALLHIPYMDRYGDCWMNIMEVSYWDNNGNGGVILYRRPANCGGSSDGGGTGGGGSGYPPQLYDCANVAGGTAYESDCGCVGGTTGISIQAIDFEEDAISNAGDIEEIEEGVMSNVNPAKITYTAQLRCSAYMGSGVPVAVVESVCGMSMTVVNGSSTTYLPDGTEDSWYTTLINKSYSHSLCGFPSITLTWNATKIVRHTITKPNHNPITTIVNKYISTSKTKNAYLP